MMRGKAHDWRRPRFSIFNTTKNRKFIYRNMFEVLQSHVITNKKLRWLSLNVTLTQTSFNYSASPVSYVTMTTFKGSGKIFVGDDELEWETIASFRNTSNRVHAIFLFFSWWIIESGMPQYSHLSFKVAEHSFSARFLLMQFSTRTRISKNKHVVNWAIILFAQHPHYLCYFSV